MKFVTSSVTKPASNNLGVLLELEKKEKLIMQVI